MSAYLDPIRKFAAVTVLALAISPAARAARPKNVDAPLAKSLSDLFDGVKFRSIGPYRGGRSVAVTGVPGEPYTFYFGGTGGGVFKTTDGGSHWEPVSDKDFKTGSVGALAVAASDHNVIYAGMGESPIRGNLSHGDGVYKSTDAGKSWKNVGLADTRQIARVVVEPGNPDRVFVAALGHAWAPSTERGIFRSDDGGKSWKRVLFVDDSTGASDLSMDPNNPRTLYAGFWSVVRKPWTLENGGPGSSLYRSTDGGDSWKKLAEGLPEGIWGRVGVAASKAKPGRVWAMIQAKKGGLFRSEDGGEKWKLVNAEHKIRERAWYYSWIYPDPKNPDALYLPNVAFHVSIDGGKTFSEMPVPHGDNHDLWIDPAEPSRMILGNDGGATITFNGGKSWSTQDNQPTAQFYRVITDDRFPYWVYGAQQDNSTVGIPSGVVNSAEIDTGDWHDVGGGESGWIAPDPRDPNIVYAGGYGGAITRYDHHTRQYREIDPWPQLADGHATRDLKYRYQWNAPLFISRHDPKRLFFASQILMESTDEGQTWREASPDLTRNDRDKQGYAGGPIDHDVTGVEVYDTIFSFADSTLEPGMIWAGSDDGLIHLTRDDCKTWSDVTPKGVPEWIQINSIEASPVTRGTAYVAATMYRFDDFRPYLLKTSDYGKSWTKITDGIPDGAFTRVIRQDPVRAGLLYAGTETGLYISFDDGGHWQPFQRNLPVVPITDLAVKNGDLVVATQGRAFWILDDLSPLRQWNNTIASSDVHVFDPRPSFRMQTGAVEERPDQIPTAGLNVPNGVVFDYWLKDKPRDDEKVSIDILADGKVIRHFAKKLKKKEAEDDGDSDAAEPEDKKDEKEKPLEPKAGLNRFIWDMRILKPTLVPKAVFNEGSKDAPKVAPGAYEIRLTVGEKSVSTKVEIRPQPGLAVTAADLQAQYDLLSKLRDGLSRTHELVLKIRDLKSQIKDIAEHAKKTGKGEPIEVPARDLTKKLTSIEEELTNPKIQADEDDLNYLPKIDHDFTNLAGGVSSADSKPTASQVAYEAVLARQLDAIQARFDEVVAHDLADFNRKVSETKLPPVVVLPKVGEDES